MFNSIIKDKNRRNRFKKAEIKNLQNKSIFQDQILFKNFNAASKRSEILYTYIYGDKDISTNHLHSKLNQKTPYADSNGKDIRNLTNKQMFENTIDLQKDRINKLYLFWLQKCIKSSTRKSNLKNCSITQIKNRCIESARARSILRFCRLSRIVLRDKASKGLIPGVEKASW